MDNNTALVDPILQKVEAAIEEKVQPELKELYDFIVVNGAQIMYADSMTKFVKARMDRGGNPAVVVATGAADLVAMVYQRYQTESVKRKQPLSQQEKDQFGAAGLSACISLMCQALDMAEKLGKVQLTAAIIDQCVQETYKATMRKFGISENDVRVALMKAQQQTKPAQKVGA